MVETRTHFDLLFQFVNGILYAFGIIAHFPKEEAMCITTEVRSKKFIFGG